MAKEVSLQWNFGVSEIPKLKGSIPILFRIFRNYLIFNPFSATLSEYQKLTRPRWTLPS